jgi:hypothetical protein
MRPSTQTRVRQFEIGAERPPVSGGNLRCTHLTAVATGPLEACLQEVAGSTAVGLAWVYAQRYQCPECGARFVETHAQTVPRDLGDAMV